MIVGLLPLKLVASYLGKREDAMSLLVEEDGFPVIKVPTATKSVRKVSLMSLHKWLVSRSENDPIKLEDLEAELERLKTAAKKQEEESR